jgi:hypothetical protein
MTVSWWFPPWFHWQPYAILIPVVFLVCRVIGPKFLIRRVAYGTLALVFNSFAAYMMIQAIWGKDVGCLSPPPLWEITIVSAFFGLIGLLFTWRFAVWQLRASQIQIRTLPAPHWV